MEQPALIQPTLREIQITCFICEENLKVTLKPFQSQKQAQCPKCNKKELIITSTS
jgi:hypothetical protein